MKDGDAEDSHMVGIYDVREGQRWQVQAPWCCLHAGSGCAEGAGRARDQPCLLIKAGAKVHSLYK
jgi:hypothetical protein